MTDAAKRTILYLTRQRLTLARATVYNTLNAVAQAGLVRVISPGGTEKRSAAALGSHSHFVGGRCGAITNFAIDIARFQPGDLARFEIHARDGYFHGLCPRCLNQPRDLREDQKT